MQVEKNHIDGVWWTYEENYKGHKLVTKMRKGKGSKIHIWNLDNTKVLKTFRFVFATEQQLISKAKTWIDKQI